MTPDNDNTGKISMSQWMLANGSGYDVHIKSEDDLIRALAEADGLARDEGRPRVVVLASDIGAEDAPYLSIGVGSDDSVLVYEAGDGEGGGYSKGSRTGDKTPVTFAYGTAQTEYLAWMLIPGTRSRPRATSTAPAPSPPTSSGTTSSKFWA